MDLHNLHRYGSSGSRATQFWPHASDVPSSEKIWYSSAPRITPNEGKTMEIKREDIHIYIYIIICINICIYIYIHTEISAFGFDAVLKRPCLETFRDT